MIPSQESGPPPLDTNADEGEKVDYIPGGIPQVREVEQAQSYYAYKVGGVTFFLLAIIAIVGGVCGSGHCSGGSKAEPVTSAPTSYRSTLSLEFEAKLLEEFGDDYLDAAGDLADVRWQALNWIMYQDPMQLDVDAENLIQRYILALFYFQTSQERPWIDCDPSGPDLCYPQGYVFEATHASDAWLSDSHECFWANVKCEGVGNWNVTAIQLCKCSLETICWFLCHLTTPSCFFYSRKWLTWSYTHGTIWSGASKFFGLA